jgi:FMN phosphatase YigB (HAD superfamily)
MLSPMPTRLETPPAGGDARLKPAFEAVAAGELRAMSVDVFDTLLFRRVTDPVDAFELVGERLLAQGALTAGTTPGVFARVRRAAEERARERRAQAGDGPEVTLAEIHALLPRALFTGDPGAALEAERAVESELLVPDLDVAALLEAASAAGLPLVAVSDTYFSERDLRLFIARGPLAGLRLDRVFASSDHGTGKATGLFSVVLEQLGIAPGELLHVGDNHESDVAAPRRLGIDAVYFEKRTPALARIVERERLHLPPAPAPDGGTAALRGKVLHRADAEDQPAGQRPFWEFGAATLGPAFAGFGDWVREQATELGVSRVFCLMREGELLSQLVNAAGETPIAEPVWLSRHVTARASIREGTVQELEALFSRRDMPTVREFVASLGVSLEELPAFASAADRRIDDRGLGDEVVDAVVFDPELRARVVARSGELRRRLLRYVESRLPPGERRLALVDLGWGGTIQATVEALLRESGVECATAGLYLITNHVALDRSLEGLEVRGFLGDYGVPETAIRAIGRSPELLEQVCMPDCGTQVGLTEELQPVLAAPGEMSVQSVERAAVQQGILTFQREWRRYRRAQPAGGRELTLTGPQLRPRLLAMVTRAVTAPTPEEAPLFAGWLHDENFGSDRVESIAAGPSVKALGHLDPRALMKVPMTELYWPFGLAGLHDEHLAGALAAASSGTLPWDTFSSSLEIGSFVVEGDFGWGFEDRAKGTIAPRRNRRGLSYARATVRGEFVQRLRLRPAQRPCLLRFDWIRLRCRLHGGDSVAVDLDGPKDFARMRVKGAHWVAPGLLMVTGGDPRLELDLRRLAGEKVYEAVVEVGFAALALPYSRAPERRGRAKGRLRRIAKETRLGAPLRLARRLLHR